MSPENSTRSDRHNYQTELLNNLMDHVLAADVLLGDQAALSTSSSGSVTYTHLANNVFYLAGRIVDKLWQGLLNCPLSIKLPWNLFYRPPFDYVHSDIVQLTLSAVNSHCHTTIST